MSEQHNVVYDQMPRRLPPPEAWRQPDKWLDLTTGYARADIKRSYLSTDERGFVMPDEAVKEIKSLFWADYVWLINNKDPELKPDPHHFHHREALYLPKNNNGNPIPQLFRESPDHIGDLPRPVHNVAHDFFYEPKVPALKHMTEYVEAYIPAREAFKKVLATAALTTEVQRLFPLRREDVARHPERIGHQPYDIHGENYLRSSFNIHHSSYKQALEELESIANKELIYPDFDKIINAKPHVAVAKLGKVVTRETINFLPQFLLKVA
jgi:hypothetical protein